MVAPHSISPALFLQYLRNFPRYRLTDAYIDDFAEVQVKNVVHIDVRLEQSLVSLR